MRVLPVCLLGAVIAAVGCVVSPGAASADYVVVQWTHSAEVTYPDTADPNYVVSLDDEAQPELAESAAGKGKLVVKHQGQHTHDVSLGGRVYRPADANWGLGEASAYEETGGTLPAATPPGWAWLYLPPGDLEFNWDVTQEPSFDISNMDGLRAKTDAHSLYFVEGVGGGGAEVTDDYQWWEVDLDPES